MDNSNSLNTTLTGSGIMKILTKIRGMDEILYGGLPLGRTTLITGGPGTGKTVFGLEFLYRNALVEETGIFITFEETAAAIRRNALAMGWNLALLEERGSLNIMDIDVPLNIMQSGDFTINGLLGILSGKVKTTGAKYIVIDAIDVLMRLFRDANDCYNQLASLHNWIIKQELTTILTIKQDSHESVSYQHLEYMTDCVIQLDQRILTQVMTRRLRVLKYRGSGFWSNEFPYIITSIGIVVIPITKMEFAQQCVGTKFSTGIKNFDNLLSGGLLHGSCILIAGSSGSGKTTLASSIGVSACYRGERVIYVSFEESVGGLTSGMRSAGIEMQPEIDSRLLHIQSIVPESAGVEEHLWRIFQLIDLSRPDHIIIDAISACRRMGTEAMAFDFLVRLLTYCKTEGITCIYLNQTGSENPVDEISGIGISSLVDSIIVLEQLWPKKSHQRRLLITKIRGSSHSHLYHDFSITDKGILIHETSNLQSASNNK
jgi:circadian clock protein KaiC